MRVGIESCFILIDLCLHVVIVSLFPRRFTSAQQHVYSIDDEAHAIICSDAETGDRIMQLNANRTGTIDQLSLSPDNQHLAAATEKGALIIDAETLAIVRTIQPSTATYSLAYSPDGRHLAIDGDNYIIRLLSIERGYEQVGYGKGHHAEIWCIAFAPSRNLVVSLSDDESVIVWATPNMTMAYVLRGHISAADTACLLYTSPSPRDGLLSRMPSSA